MLVLAIDTSGRKGSVALCRGDGHSFELLQLTPLDHGTYSARLIPVLSKTLAQNNLDASDVDAFAVVSGPGSFTGLRVGLATVKGLCEALQKPLAAISMLAAVALTHGVTGEMATTILDAGRGEIYVGEYQLRDGRANQLREYIAKLEEFAAEAGNGSGSVLTTDAAFAQRLQEAGRGVKLVAPIQADEVGRIGIEKLLAGEVADPATVDVNYIRRSDAELFSPPRRSSV
jgi:tRNA threonylcarbamoyladenosine biosynthesis protein TsaB